MSHRLWIWDLPEGTCGIRFLHSVVLMMTSLRVWQYRFMDIFTCINSYRHMWNTCQGQVSVDIRMVWPGNCNLTFTSFARQKYSPCTLMTHRKPSPQTNSFWLVMKWQWRHAQQPCNKAPVSRPDLRKATRFLPPICKTPFDICTYAALYTFTLVSDDVSEFK